MAASKRQSSTGTKRRVSAAARSRSSASSGKRGYVVCVSSTGYEASLEPRKIYVVLDDPHARRRGFVRVIDESGEDYLYPSKRFEKLTLTPSVARALSRAR